MNNNYTITHYNNVGGGVCKYFSFKTIYHGGDSP